MAIATVLVLAAGAFAVASLVGDDAPSSPEAAVEALFGAIEDQDVLGVLDALAPGERQVYQPFIEDMVSELQRLDILSRDLDLGAIGGIEIEVDGLELESAPLGEGVSVVSVVGGTITSTVDPDGVPLGSFIRDLMEDPDAGVEIEPLSTTEALAEDEPFDLVVIDDGGWHVSLHYTIAELARQEVGAPAPVFGAGVQPDGAATPEEAVEELLQAGVDLDLRRVIALTPPGEMSALHDYAPLFLDDANRAIAALRSETSFDISIDRLDTDAVRDCDVAKVTILGFQASGQADGGAFEAFYDGECFGGTYEGETEEVCLDDLEQEGMSTRFSRKLVDAQLGVMTVERNGEWYVSPTRSVLQVFLAVVRAIDRDDLDDPERFLSEAFGLPFSPFGFGYGFDEPFGSVGGTIDEGWAVEDELGTDGSVVDPYAECDTYFDDLPADATDEQYDEAGRAAEDCYSRLSGTGLREPVPGEECWAVYDELGPEATEEDFSAADRAHQECIEAATGG